MRSRGSDTDPSFDVTILVRMWRGCSLLLHSLPEIDLQRETTRHQCDNRCRIQRREPVRDFALGEGQRQRAGVNLASNSEKRYHLLD